MFYVMIDQNSFIREWPFFAKKIFRESFANSMSIFRGAMLSNNSSSQDSVITCHITQNHDG
jgi:hypothetical protein